MNKNKAVAEVMHEVLVANACTMHCCPPRLEEIKKEFSVEIINTMHNVTIFTDSKHCYPFNTNCFMKGENDENL